MFGLGRLFRREISKPVQAVVQPPQTMTKILKVTKQVFINKSNIQPVETQTAEQKAVNYKCQVIDSDTITIGKQHICLAGKVALDPQNLYCGKACWALLELCIGQNVTAYLTGESYYDCVVAKCFLDKGKEFAA